MKHERSVRSNVTRSVFRALNSVVQPAIEAGIGNPLPIGAGLIVLEVTGRVSGTARRVPLLANRLGNRLIVSTARSDSQWLRNVEANSLVTVHLFGTRRDATAEVHRGPLNVVLIVLT